MILRDLVELNCNDDDKILLVDSYDFNPIIASSTRNDNLRLYYKYEVSYIGVSNDLGTNLLVFIKFH